MFTLVYMVYDDNDHLLGVQLSNYYFRSRGLADKAGRDTIDSLAETSVEGHFIYHIVNAKRDQTLYTGEEDIRPSERAMAESQEEIDETISQRL